MLIIINPVRVFHYCRFVCWLALLLKLTDSPQAAAQATVLFDDGGTVMRPAPCWTMTMEFYDTQAYPYFEVNGYYFDANPFGMKRMIQLDEMIMQSARGGALTDMSGRKVWSPTTVLVNCYEVTYMFGLITQPYAVVTQIYGTVTDKSLACTGGGGSGSDPTMIDTSALWDTSYDPYADSGGDNSGCSNESGSGGSLPPGTTCNEEWVTIEISYDGGVTWETWWEGEATVCG